MRKLVFLLATTTALFAAATAYLYLNRVHPVPHSNGVVAGATMAVAAPTPTPAANATMPPAAKLVTHADTSAPSASKAAAPGPQPNPQERAFLDRESDPALRAQLLEETKVALRREHPGIERIPGFDAALGEQLLSLLAEHRIQGRKNSIECKYDASCGTGFKQLREMQQAEVTALLGPDGKLKYYEYLESRGERLNVNTMRGRLTDKNRLSDSQAEALTAALAEERQHAELEMSGNKKAVLTFDGVPFLYAPGTTFDEIMQQANTYQARLHKRAAELLAPTQLAVYDQVTAERMIAWRAMARSTVEEDARLAR